jgi:transposase
MRIEKVTRIRGGKPSHVYPSEQIVRIVEEVESEKISIGEALSRYEITLGSLKRWIRTYGKSECVPSAFNRLTNLQKRQIINEIETGKITFPEALKRYKVRESTLYYWRKKYSDDIACKKTPGNMDNHDKAEHHGKENEQVESLKLKIAALETMIDLAEREFNIPIRKKCGSKQ